MSLGKSAPPIIFAIGSLKILRLPSIAIVGSRECSAKGLALTTKLAGFFAQRGFNVVSGYARGVDTAAHEGAARFGKTTIVLPFGILHYRTKIPLRRVLTKENSLVISEFKPAQKWFVRAAMQRNKTICGLSDAVIVVEARPGGGALDEGLEAIRQGKPLYVIEYKKPPGSARGNRLLISSGGRALATWRDVVSMATMLGARKERFTFARGIGRFTQHELPFDEH